MSWLVRIAIPVGDEVARLALGQAPAWVTGFALGVVGAERGWLDPVPPALGRWARRVGVGAFVAAAVVIGAAAALDADIDAFAGGGTWQSLVLAAIEGALVGLVLASHTVAWPPETEWLVVGVLGVGASFGVGTLVTRLPGIGRYF